MCGIKLNKIQVFKYNYPIQASPTNINKHNVWMYHAIKQTRSFSFKTKQILTETRQFINEIGTTIKWMVDHICQKPVWAKEKYDR